MLKNMNFIFVLLFTLYFVFSFMPRIGFAQQDLPVPVAPTNRNLIGVVGVVVPDYVGSDDYMILPAPLLTYHFLGQRFFKLIVNQAFVNVLNHPNWEFGAKAVYRLGRGDSVKVGDSVVARLDDVDDSFELGGFIGYGNIIGGDVRHRYNINLDITQDVSDGHDGFLIDLGGSYWRPVARPFDIGFSGVVTYASDDYMSSYFDISAEESIRTGLPVFDADEGFKEVRVGMIGLMHLSFTWHVGAGVFYGRLLSDAEDSPVVDDRGSANQYYGAVCLMYSW